MGSPSYNEENGKFVTEISEYVTKDETFMEVIFKVKEGSKKNINISMENISVANQDEEIEVSSTSKIITLKGNVQIPDINTSTNQNTNTNSSSNTNNITNSNLRPINSNASGTNSAKNGTLPNTGKTNINPIIVIAICIVLVVALIMRLKATQNKGKH